MMRGCRTSEPRTLIMDRRSVLRNRSPGATASGFMTASVETRIMPGRSRLQRTLLALSLIPCFASAAAADDYAGAISVYRRAHGLPAVRSDSRLSAVALKQARAMAATGTVSHIVGGNFAMRVAPLRKSRAAENIGAGYLGFADMLKQWEE